jgi:hypothetical protein
MSYSAADTESITGRCSSLGAAPIGLEELLGLPALEQVDAARVDQIGAEGAVETADRPA